MAYVRNRSRFFVRALLSLLLLPPAVQAAGWFDDFNDGDAEDGVPVTWTYNELGFTPGSYDASSGDYILSAPLGPTFDDDTLVASVGQDFTDTYARTQALVQPGTLPDEVGGNVGLGVRFNPFTFSGYVAVLDHAGLLTVVRSDGGFLVELDAPRLPILAITDVLVEMVAIGGQIDTYVWEPGQARPSTPASSVFDLTYSSGRAGIVFNEDDDNTAGIFRFAAAQDAPFVGECDFNSDTRCDITDLDMLTMEVASGGSQLLFDLTGDGVVDRADVNDAAQGWLTQGGSANPQITGGNPFLEGDANLDGVSDVSDFNIWNMNKFSPSGRWSQGDFNADGSSDVSDFNVWNGTKFTSSVGVAAVPEPAALAGWLWALAAASLLGRHRSR